MSKLRMTMTTDTVHETFHLYNLGKKFGFGTSTTQGQWYNSQHTIRDLTRFAPITILSEETEVLLFPKVHQRNQFPLLQL